MDNQITTQYTQEERDCANMIREKKKGIEANIVFSIYKEPSLLEDYDLKREDFVYNEYKVLFEIANQLYLKEKTKIADEIAIGLYLENHQKLADKYNGLGGYSTIETGISMIESNNIDSYIESNNKYNTLLKLVKEHYPIWTMMDIKDSDGRNYNDKTLEEIYDEWEYKLNNIFSKAQGNVKIEDLSDGIDELYESWDKGELIGLPLSNCPRLTDMIGGLSTSSTILIASTSNTGKSSILRSMIIPSLLECNEPSIFILNEENKARFVEEECARIINNEFKVSFNKSIIWKGHFTQEQSNLIKRAMTIIKDRKKDHLLNFVSLPEYTTEQAIKIIKKCKASGIHYSIIDTFKQNIDISDSNKQGWTLLKNNMVKLTNLARTKDVCIVATCQLAPRCDMLRYLNRSGLAEATGIIESVSTALLLRKLWSDEYQGETHALEFFDIKDGKQFAVELDKFKNYMIVFCDKTRRGSKDLQIVLEVDFAHNTLKEVCYTKVPFGREIG